MELDIRNLAGIREGHAALQPGVNAVRGLNWQGKSSFVRAIETAMGTATTLTEGADEGHVVLTRDGESHRVDLTRENGTVARSGDPYLTDEYDRVCAALYAFLDDDNPVRGAVRRGENLEELLTRPLDFEDIDERIGDLTAERDAVERELERAETAARELPGVQSTVSGLEDDLAERQAERADLLDRRAGDDEGGDIAAARESLSAARAERTRLQERIERLRNAIERTEAELESRRAERDDLIVPEVDVEAELAEATEALTEAERDVELVRDLYSANRRLVEEDRLDLVADVERGLMADSVACWVCGTDAEVDDIEARIETLGERVRTLNERVTERRERVETLRSERQDARDARRTAQDLDRTIRDLEATLGDREESLNEATEQLAAVEDRIDDLADTVADSDERLTDLQSEIKYTEAQLADARDRLDELESAAARTDTLRAELDDLQSEITDLRERKDRVKTRTREAFDAAIDDLVTRFETSFETARLTDTYELVVARDGREVSLDALSEGELELIGIVTALAGYEAYDVADRVPVLLLDGLGGLADRNLQLLVEYLRDTPEYLVFTAYPEHTPFDGHQIDPAQWTVVSDGASAAD